MLFRCNQSMRRSSKKLFFSIVFILIGISNAFFVCNNNQNACKEDRSSLTPFQSQRRRRCPQQVVIAASIGSSDQSVTTIGSVEEASSILSNWDSVYNSAMLSDKTTTTNEDHHENNELRAAVLLLNQVASQERLQDFTKGRCMLGICAASAQEGIQTLKSWVTTLQLPRGLLHGMDQDGVPLELEGAVYIKYNTGGCLTFSDIRQSGLGFDALWKPGDALLEPYDGTYRGCYFQVELSDGVFRQYLLPLNLFDSAN